ncbi:ankyrin repeat domain-containing protein [Actinokineospora sp.]|uniref:ankyrin repeat domain-containing protein n=1 Tax=Actinokineospora sp. TaxID=1872133 RepID=UPI004037B7E1
MPVYPLPDSASLEHLRKQAKDLLAQHPTGGEWATGLVAEFHPDPAAPLKLSGAQLVVARQYGFPSWPKLVAHLRVVAEYSRSPHQVTEFADPEAEFLAHACLVYGGDSPLRRDRARALLAAHPEIATASMYTIAALGDADAARALLARDPARARLAGGPYDWEPLLYLAYSRVDGGDPVAVARLLLDAGADPNAGYLWEGLTSPFTALTGVFGEGEGGVNQPRHPAQEPLARVLLSAGADPNDSQTLYNRMFNADDSHLRLLFEFGLGRGDGGPWHARLGSAHQTPAEMLHDVLLWAASHNQRDRVALLLANGVHPAGPHQGHPAHGGRGPLELAVRAGSPEIADLLVAAGASMVELDEVARFLAAAMRGDADAVRAASPDLVARAIAREPTAVVYAAEVGSLDAVRLLAGAGFDVNAASRETALHQAAFTGNLPLARLLLDLGADPSIADCSHNSTPLGWAEYNEQHEVAAFLRTR